MSQSSQLIDTAQRTIQLEIEAVEQLRSRIDERFVHACELILACKGRVVVVGMGKSGHIGRKIAATLASTGTPAFFVHPAEASHGDMGMITRDDVVLALSNSGTTSEIVTLLPLIKRLGLNLISMTGNPESVLAKAAVVNLDASVAVEACPLNLAPPPQPPSAWYSATHLPSRYSKRAASPPRTSHFHIQGARLAGACCSRSNM